MGIASVGLTYDLTRRTFGRAAGGAAGLVLATTPIAVAISRHNNPDALLILCCTAALWFIVRALDDGRTRWLVLSGVAIGLGFETKMAAALLVVPALAAAYLWVAPKGRRAALRQLLAGAGAMIAVGGAWPLLMALTPPGSRPWISGTSDNSILNLIFGYNGFGRLDGQAGGPQVLGGGPGGGGPGGGNGGPFGGQAGVGRLFNAALGGQAGWLLGFAVLGGVAIVVVSRLRRDDRRTGWIIATGGIFATTAIAFSFAQGIFHPYYVSQLAPFSAALVGAGAVQLVRAGRPMRVLAPLAVAAAVASELLVLHQLPGQFDWLKPVLIVGGVVAAAGLALQISGRARAIAIAAALGLFLIAPASWAVDTLGHATNGTFPAGGPADAALGGGFGGPGGGRRDGRLLRFGPGAGNRLPGGPGGGFGAPPGAGRLGGFGGPGGGPFGQGGQALASVARYTRGHGGGTIAVSSQSTAARQIIASGVDVAGIGGFSGRESQVSASWLADAVDAGRVRWVLADGGGRFGPGNDSRVGSRDVMTLVANTCTRIPASAYGSASPSTTQGTTGALYDCRGKSAALRAAA
jgi:4-amino-4-deoxy-L-arabinose transferase-like glycosyltransferase